MAAVLVLWWLVTAVGLASPFVLPSPRDLLVELGALVRGGYAQKPLHELSLAPATGTPGAAGMIQPVADFLLAQDIVKTKVDGRAAVDGSYVAEYQRARR